MKNTLQKLREKYAALNRALGPRPGSPVWKWQQRRAQTKKPEEKAANKALWVIAIFLGIIVVGGIIAVAAFFTGVKEVTRTPEVEISVLRAEERNEDTYGLWPDEGKTFLYLQVRMVSKEAKEDISINPFYFKLETDTLVKYNYHDHDGALVTLSPGGTHTFWVSFEIPEDQRGARLYFEEVFREAISAPVPSY